jgi:hypothetical protein
LKGIYNTWTNVSYISAHSVLVQNGNNHCRERNINSLDSQEHKYEIFISLTDKINQRFKDVTLINFKLMVMKFQFGSYVKHVSI